MVTLDYHLSIKEMPEELRPRERIAKRGPEVLSNQELLAIILRTGNKAETAVELAARLIAAFGNLTGLILATVEELSQIKGIGLAKACQIKAAVELSKRLTGTAAEERPIVKSPGDVSRLLMSEMRYLDREHFKTVLLNTKNHVTSVETISVGCLSSSIVHPREVFKNPIKKSAAAIILVHNHPSGDPSPSKEDVEVTLRLNEAGRLLGIDILDHIIIGDNRYCSLKEQGLI